MTISIVIDYPDGTTPVPVRYTSNGRVIGPEDADPVEISGLVVNTATGEVWEGDPLTQMVDPEPAPVAPNWWIEFPKPGVADLPFSTELVETVFVTDGSASDDVVFTTEDPPVPPHVAKLTAAWAGAGKRTPEDRPRPWDGIWITDARAADKKVTVTGQTKAKKAEVIVVLVPRSSPPKSPKRRYSSVKKTKSQNRKWEVEIPVDQPSTYLVIAMVRYGQRRDRTWVEVKASKRAR